MERYETGFSGMDDGVLDLIASEHEVTRRHIDNEMSGIRIMVHSFQKMFLITSILIMATLAIIFTIYEQSNLKVVEAHIAVVRAEQNYQFDQVHQHINQLERRIDEISGIAKNSPDTLISDEAVFDEQSGIVVDLLRTAEVANQTASMEPESEPDPIVYNTKRLLEPSGFTAAQFDAIIEETFARKFPRKDIGIFADLGGTLYQIEQDNGFNALYILGIGCLESGYGKSTLAKTKNNPYGLLGMSFDSIADSTTYLGNLLQRSYIGKGRTSLTEIGKKYCPPTYQDWASSVQWITNQYIETANALIAEGKI